MEDPKDKELRHERRKHVRVDIYAVTRYFCPTRKRDIGIQTRLSDISEGGARLLTFEEGIPVGTDISVTFILPTLGEETVTVKGRVRHSGILEEGPNPSQSLFRSGIEFLDLSPKNRKIIQDYVASKRDK